MERFHFVEKRDYLPISSLLKNSVFLVLGSEFQGIPIRSSISLATVVKTL